MTSARAIAFRAPAGARSGLGHLRRCLSLAGELRRRGTRGLFLTEPGSPAIELVAQAGEVWCEIDPACDAQDTARQVAVHGAAALVVDSYNHGPDFFRFQRARSPRTILIAVDDLAIHELPVDLVVDGSPGAEALGGRAGPGAEGLLGASYALLRPEFAQPPPPDAHHDRRVLVTFGGSDPCNLTARLVDWACQALGDARVDAVIGPFFGDCAGLETVASAYGNRVTLHSKVGNMRGLMLAASFAISAGGQTTYELAATGTPAIAVRLADNQTRNLQRLAAEGCLIWAGDSGDSDLGPRVRDQIGLLAGDPQRRQSMGARGRAVIDGRGAARVAARIIELIGG